MEINDKILMELAGQIGLNAKGAESKEKMSQVAKMAESMKGKSNEELMKEILQLKGNMKSNPEQFKKSINSIKAFSSMMNEEQKTQLNKVLGMLED